MPARPTAPDPTTPLALRCAAHVHAAIGWRAPEAGALAAWLHQCAHDFGREIEMLDEDGDPVAVGPRFPRLSAGDWHRIGAALRDPEAAGPPGGVLTRWVAAIARRLAKSLASCR